MKISVKKLIKANLIILLLWSANLLAGYNPISENAKKAIEFYEALTNFFEKTTCFDIATTSNYVSYDLHKSLYNAYGNEKAGISPIAGGKDLTKFKLERLIESQKKINEFAPYIKHIFEFSDYKNCRQATEDINSDLSFMTDKTINNIENKAPNIEKQNSEDILIKDLEVAQPSTIVSNDVANEVQDKDKTTKNIDSILQRSTDENLNNQQPLIAKEFLASPSFLSETPNTEDFTIEVEVIDAIQTVFESLCDINKSKDFLRLLEDIKEIVDAYDNASIQTNISKLATTREGINLIASLNEYIEYIFVIAEALEFNEDNVETFFAYVSAYLDSQESDYPIINFESTDYENDAIICARITQTIDYRQKQREEIRQKIIQLTTTKNLSKSYSKKSRKKLCKLDNINSEINFLSKYIYEILKLKQPQEYKHTESKAPANNSKL